MKYWHENILLPLLCDAEAECVTLVTQITRNAVAVTTKRKTERELIVLINILLLLYHEIIDKKLKNGNLRRMQ
jgi:hypothetical protein